MRSSPFMLILAACGGGPTLEEVDQLIADHAAEADAHGGPYASAVDVAAAVGAHDADDDAHQGLFASPDDVDAAIAAAEVAVAQLPVRRRRISLSLGASYDLGGGNWIGGGGFGNSGLIVTDASGSDFAFSFTVPDDLVGDTMTYEVVWRVNQTGCEFDLRPNSIDRGRPGMLPSSGGATDGFAGPAESKTVPAVAEMAAKYTYTIGAGGGYASLDPGDTIHLSLYRYTNDSCTADVHVTGVSLTYDAQ